MKKLKDLVTEKNEMVTKGQILEAIEKYFAEDARISVHRVGVGDDVTLQNLYLPST